MQSDASSSSSGSGNNPANLSDDQKLLGKPPLQSILKPPSASRPSRKNDTVIEMELAALTAVAALSVVSPTHHNDIDSDKDDRGKQSNQGSPELPMHLRPSLSPPPSPVTSPCSTPKRFIEQDDVGTLGFMAGRGFDDDESMKPIEKIAEKKQKSKENCHVTADPDPMDCSTLVAMAGINSVVESFEPIKKVTVDRATSPTMPAHLIMTGASNMNTNNNNAAETVTKEKALVDEEEEAKKLKEQHRAQLLTQYHHVFREKRLKRTGSAGSIGSRLSLPSALSLIPESQQVPASRGVTDKVSNEFPLLTGNSAAAASLNVVGMSASATGVVVVTEEPIKRVSFQDLSPSPTASNGAMPVPAGELQRLIGRPLPARPLPPIGGADANVFSEGNFPTMSPRSGNSRPLPPLNGMGMGSGNSIAYDTMSLHSAGSSTILYKTGSTNSLPTPDPRYVRGHLHKLMGGAKRKTPPPSVGSHPLPTSMSMGISNIGAGRLSPYQAQ